MKKYFKILLLVLLAPILQACPPGSDPSIDIEYTLECSEFLLQNATPQISYKGNDGQTVIIQVNDNDWKETSSPSVPIKVNDKEINNSMKKWTKTVRYDDFGTVDDELTITYIPKDDASNYNGSLLPYCQHHLSLTGTLSDEDGDKTPFGYIDEQKTIVPNNEFSLSDGIKQFRDYRGIHATSNGTINYKK